MKTVNIEVVKAAVKAQKWDKAGYVYALDHMEYKRNWSQIASLYKKAEIIEKFLDALEDAEKFERIEKFTTFAGLDVWVKEPEVPSAVYASVRGNDSWDRTPQIYLGVITWSQALAFVDGQTKEVRLCHSAGYHNQGHYIQPRKDRA